jgi:hypothetical protein
MPPLEAAAMPKPSLFTEADALDDVIEDFYQDNAKIVSGLLSVVSAMAYDPLETGDVYSFYAKFFWASVRGERFGNGPDAYA